MARVCVVKENGREERRLVRFVAVATMDDPEGCQVVTQGPATDLGSVVESLANYVLDSPVPDARDREAAAAAVLEGCWHALQKLGDEYPALAAGLVHLATAG